jgi:hypothetical protein
MPRFLVVAARLPWFVVVATLLLAWSVLYAAAWSLTVILVRMVFVPLAAFAALFRNEQPSFRWVRDAVAEPYKEIPRAWERRIGWLLVHE